MTDFANLDRPTVDALDAAARVSATVESGERDLAALVDAAVVVVESAGVKVAPGPVAWTVARLATTSEWSAVFDSLLVEAVEKRLAAE